MIICYKRSRRTATMTHVGYRHLKARIETLEDCTGRPSPILPSVQAFAGQAISRFSPAPPIIMRLDVAPAEWDRSAKNRRVGNIEFLTLGSFPRHRNRRRYALVLLLAAAMVSFTSLYWALVRDTLPDGGVVFGDEEQDTSSPQAIVAQCELFMQKNLLTGSAFGYNYSFNRPSSFKYSPSQWLWGKISSTAHLSPQGRLFQ